jgi:putative membrane protein
MNAQSRISIRLAAAAAAAILCTALSAQVTPTPTMTPDQPTADEGGGNLDHHDRWFVRKAAEGGMEEVAISQAVMDKLTNAQLKEFAQTMITDHTAANNELATLAGNKGVKLPAAKDWAEDWSKKSGDVDKKYIKKMVSDHKEAVKLFEKGSESKDADIAAFAQKTLPTLQHHLSMAEDLEKTVD